MATHLHHEEQEQLEQVKHFWQRYGNLITALLVIAVLVYGGFSGWNWWQRDQAIKASSMYDELDRAVQAGDLERTGRVFGDLKERFPGTAFAGQGGLLAAKLQFEKGQADAAQASLTWVADKGSEASYRAVARLRLAGLLLDQKKYPEALKALEGEGPKEFAALTEDRRGDILIAQGDKDGAKAAYTKAWQTMDAAVDYRRLIDAKLTALGAAPAAPSASAAKVVGATQ